MAPSSDDSSSSDSPPSSSSSSSSDSSSNSPPSNSGNSGGSSNDNSGGNNSNDSSGGKHNNNSNSSGSNDNSKGDNGGDKGSSGKDDSGQSNNNNSSGQSNNSNDNNSSNNNNDSGQNSNSNSGQNNDKNSGQSNNDSNNNSGQNNNNNNNNNNSGQNNNNQNNNNNQSNNGNENNNSGGNSNSQTSQGNHPPPPPPKSSSTYWHTPPPPLSIRKSPPTTTLSDGDDKASPSTSRSSSNTPIIIGLVAGAWFLLFIIILLISACAKRRKRRQSSHLMDNPDPYRRNGSDYWQSGPYKPNEHILNMPPPPLTSGWNNQGGPPMVSSEMNSSNFSGPHGPPLPPPHPSMALGFNTSTFTYEHLVAATSGFSQAKLLGQGGFGFVHKGLLPNGKEIAVKSLKAGSGQGDREFAAEVEIISRVHHRHLVSLVGYCLNGERKLLVYEFVPNNTLEFHLHNKNRPPLDWASRVKIALGSAKGLAYLHEDCHPKIIHRDIKTANILIDYNFEAKVADFGLAKLNQENVTHVSTRVMGTFGYLAPEYASSGKLTEKSDVFSFSIMLLELITGRRPIDISGDYEEDTLVDWARPLCLKALEDGNYSELVDPRLENKYNHEEMARMVACASSGIRHSARKRPKMSQIVRALEGDVSLDDLHQGIKPSPSALFNGSAASSEFEVDSYNANMKNFRKAALGESEDYPSSEFGGNTSNNEEMVKKL